MMTIDLDDPKWTAYALGELSDTERADLERELEGSPEARAHVEALRETFSAIELELKEQPPLALDDLQRRRIHKAAVKQPVRAKRGRWLLGAAGLAAAGAVAVTFTVQRDHGRDEGQRQASMDLPASDVTTPSFVKEKQLLDGRSNGDPHTGAVAEYKGETGLKLAVQGQQWKGTGGTYGYLERNDGQPNTNTEGYKPVGENPFKQTLVDPLSTFSIDVDTASYANIRRFLSQHQLPPPDAVRVEEMINYFRYSYPEPEAGEPFSISTEVAPSPWNPKHQLVRIGIKAPEIAAAKVPPRNLVFLIDTSGSMMPANKLPLLVQSLNLLVETLRPEDKVSVVVYAGAAGLVLPPTSGTEKDTIRTALTQLSAGGSTNGGAGIELAYDTARKSFLPGGINRVILCSDGDYNVGTTSEGGLTRLIEKEREHGVFLTVLGFGMGNVKDSTMETLADKGNGNYAYIDSLFEAKKVLVSEGGATLVTVAKDVKLQVELNPAAIAGYRLIGYENRMLAHQDFNDDKKDAGEIGAGHAVTAIYEIVPAGADVPGATKVDPLKYQKPGTIPAIAASMDELMTVKIRYKAPTGSTSKLLSRTVPTSALRTTVKAASDDFRWATAVAAFGMKLRDSPHRGDLSWSEIHELAAGAVGADTAGYRKQALQMITAAMRVPGSK